MKTINSQLLDAFDRMKSINDCNTAYSKILHAIKISDLITQLKPSDMISPFEAAKNARQEEENFFLPEEIGERLKEVRSIRQNRAFFI